MWATLRKHLTEVRWALVVGRAVLLVILAAGAFVAVQWAIEGGLDVEALRQRVAVYGPWAPAVFTLLFTLAIPLLIPGAPLTVAAGILFGPWWGTAVSVVGGTAGSMISYALGHALGAGFVRSLFGGAGGRFISWTRRNGFTGVFLLRLIPVFPFNVVNYAFALTGVTTRQLLVGTLLGLLPGTFLLAAMGDAVASIREPADLLRPGLLGPVVGLAALGLGGVWAARRLNVAPIDGESASDAEGDPEDAG